jgi:DNA polymerase elongation subunit (family B)
LLSKVQQVFLQVFILNKLVNLAMDALAALLKHLAPAAPQLSQGRIRVWLMGVQVLQKLPTGDLPETGPFVVLTCKTEQGATLSLIVTDWLPWFRVVGPQSSLDSLLKYKNWGIKSIAQESPRIKACGWEAAPDLSTQRFSSVRITVKSLYGADYVIRDMKANVPGFGDSPSELEATDTAQRPATRFLNDMNLRTSSWFTVHIKSIDYALITIGYEARCKCSNIEQSTESVSDLTIPPLRLASFDGEMSSCSRRFPNPHLGDRIFCLSTCLQIYNPSAAPTFKTVTLYLHPQRDGSTLQEGDTLIIFFSQYVQLLESWAAMLRDFDCDLGPTGWNTEAFDWPFFAQSYQQHFLPPAQRGTEALHLEIWKLIGKPQPSTRELVGRLSNSQLKDMRNNLVLEIPEYGSLLDKILHQRKDNSSHLADEKDLDDDEEEDHDFDASSLPPSVHLALRKHCEDALKLDQSPSWEPSRAIFDGIYKKFGGDAARLMTSAALSGPQHAMFLSRFKHKQCKLETRRMTTAAKGDNVRELVQRDGATVFDMMRVYKDSEKPNSMALSAAAEAHLQGIDKLDMPIEELFSTYDDTRALKAGEDDTDIMARVVRVAKYCARDAEIPLRLLSHLKYLEGWIGLSRVCNLPLDGVINGGQQARVFAELSWCTRSTHLLNHPATGWPEGNTKYKGATVMDPIAGFYDTPLSTLDFASLYPSEMSAHNLCPSTLVRNPKVAAALRAKGMCMDFDIQHEDAKGTFMQRYTFASHIPSILSQLLQGLLSQRKATKKLMESEEDPVRREILNKLQLAYKVVCNSAYGYCGSTAGSIWGPFFPVAAVTTLMGRSHIAATKAFIESSFQHPLLLDKRPLVVYGDTDSVMIRWPQGTLLDQAFWLGEQAAREVTAFLRSELLKIQRLAQGFGRDPEEMVKVLKLEHEKEMFPALMCREKKNYAYRCWTPKASDAATGHVSWKVKTDIKGLQCVRRDTVPYVSKLMLRILDCLLLERNAPKALQDVHTTLGNLMAHRIPLDELVVSKSVASSYKVQQVHIEARKRMEARGEEVPPVGGRMPFIITAPRRGAQLSLADRAEHPSYAAKASLRPDLAYYLKASFSALRKLYQSFDGDKLEAILSTMTSTAGNQGNKRLLDSGEQALEGILEGGGGVTKKKKEEKKTRALF